MENPVFGKDQIDNIEESDGAEMTVSGTIVKTALLAALAAATAMWSWSAISFAMPIFVVGLIVGLLAVIGAMWKPIYAPILAPLYAIAEGGVLGVLSAIYNAQYHGIVLQAVLVSFGILFAMLVLYQTGAITVTERLRSIVISCTFAVALLYLVNLALLAVNIHMPLLYGGSSIVVSLIIIVIAAFNFLIDFDNIEKGAEACAPKYYEWVAALGVLVTLVWLYLEVLRLLSNMNRK